MLRYKRIKLVFFANTLFVTKKSKNSRGYFCVQMFVPDKGYVYVSAMNSVSDFPKSIKSFTKEFDVPEAIISDSHKFHKSKEVRQFCQKIGKTLQNFEGCTQWENIDEFYVSLFK